MRSVSVSLQRTTHICAQLLCDAKSGPDSKEDGDYVIDMDAVADAAGKDVEKPPFYYAEESQQKQFNCPACGEFNDILGRFADRTVCSTRNDLHELENNIIPAIRTDLTGGGVPSNSLKEIGSAFDTFIGQYTDQLIKIGQCARPGGSAFARCVFTIFCDQKGINWWL